MTLRYQPKTAIDRDKSVTPKARSVQKLKSIRFRVSSRVVGYYFGLLHLVVITSVKFYAFAAVFCGYESYET